MTNYNETRQIVGKNEKKKSFHNLYFMEEVSPKAYRLEIGREKKTSNFLKILARTEGKVE